MRPIYFSLQIYFIDLFQKKFIFQLIEKFRFWYVQSSQMRHPPEEAEEIKNNSFVTTNAKNSMEINVTMTLSPFSEHANCQHIWLMCCRWGCKNSFEKGIISNSNYPAKNVTDHRVTLLHLDSAQQLMLIKKLFTGTKEILQFLITNSFVSEKYNHFYYAILIK